MSRKDLGYFAKDYLDRKGVKITMFKSNLPGKEWARAFVTRHKERLTARLADNIKRARVDISLMFCGSVEGIFLPPSLCRL